LAKNVREASSVRTKTVETVRLILKYKNIVKIKEYLPGCILLIKKLTQGTYRWQPAEAWAAELL
jgi:hypothetical protein